MCKKGHPDSLPSLPVILFFLSFRYKDTTPRHRKQCFSLGFSSIFEKKKRISCLPVILTTCPSSLFRIYMPSHHHGVEPNVIGFPERERERERASSLANS